MMKGNLLLLHGALGSSKGFENWISSLETAFHVFSPDFDGHGNKPCTFDLSIENLAHQILAYMKDHKLHQADFFGYSMGGYVALYLASIEPEKVGKIMTLGTKFAWTPEAAAEERKKLNPEKMEAKVPHFAGYLQALHPAQDWKALVHRTANMMETLGEQPLLTPTVLQGIKHEVLITLGDADNMVSQEESEQAARDLPNGSFLLLKNTPHPLEKVEPERLRSTLQSFLQS